MTGRCVHSLLEHTDVTIMYATWLLPAFLATEKPWLPRSIIGPSCCWISIFCFGILHFFSFNSFAALANRWLNIFMHAIPTLVLWVFGTTLLKEVEGCTVVYSIFLFVIFPLISHVSLE